jgi:hypothetical protein
MLKVFFYAQGPIHCEFVPEGHAVNKECMSDSPLSLGCSEKETSRKNRYEIAVVFCITVLLLIGH